MSEAENYGYEIAVVGMSGQFPGAKNLEEFWRNLCDGVESVSFFSDEELLAAGCDPAKLNEPDFVKAEGSLEGVELFDAAFFNFTPREAEMTDPQHRLFLEHAWAALEDAGYDAERHDGRIGVYAGESINSYLLRNLLPHRELLESVGGMQTVIGNDRDYLATHVSYKLNLKGPSISVQTSCSTSLVAVHVACQSLLNRECDMALAGGVSVSVPQKQGGRYQDGGIISPDGHCRAFDASAQGTVKGSGVGVVVLKRLADALAGGDTVYAVIKGSAVNNDGSMKVGYTAPSVEGQSSVIEEALAMAAVEPESVGYIEAHGTGTALGDPIEIAALTHAFRTGTEAKNFCAIGSVKTNIGHTDAAAGIAGLIKTALALKHRRIPPSLHFNSPNPNIDFDSSPFFVNAKLTDWKTDAAPRRAGVSSFGIGGTNAHVVLEEAPAPESFAETSVETAVETSSAGTGEAQLLTLSAKTAVALDEAGANLAAYLKKHTESDLADVAYTLQVGRRQFKHRRAVVCRDVSDAAGVLETPDSARVHTKAHEQDAQVVFLFSGQGAQYVGMGRGLYEGMPVFREQVDACAELLRPHLGLDLREVLYPQAARTDEAAAQLAQTAFTQPALFVVEYALARLWTAWGVQPEALVGHSIGEYAAACLSGVLSLEDALMLVAARGRLMQQQPEGAMLSISLSEDEVQPFVKDGLSLAAVNSPSMCVLSGAFEAIENAERQLSASGIVTRRLRVSHALHSTLIEAAVEPFVALFAGVELSAPQIPYVSTLTGKWATASEVTDPNYWGRHLRHTVRFSDAAAELLRDENRVLLEVGPGQTLGTLAKQQQAGTPRTVLSSLRHPQDSQPDTTFLLNTLGHLWAAGAEVDWHAFHAPTRRRRVSLPTYPFERNRYWIDPPARDAGADSAADLGRKPDDADWFYVPSWKRSVMPEANEEQEAREQGKSVLIFMDEHGLGTHVARQLEESGAKVLTVNRGEHFNKIQENAFEISPARRADYDALLKELRASENFPGKILHLWNLTGVEARAQSHDTPAESQGISGAQHAASTGEHDATIESPGSSMETRVANVASRGTFAESQERGFYSLVYLAQALGEYGSMEAVRIAVVTDGLQEVTGGESLSPEKATVLGPCKVIPLEYPHIDCRSIDVTLRVENAKEAERLARQLVAELDAGRSSSVIAYRGAHRWVQIFEPLRTPQTTNADRRRLRDGGVYLLTGGLSDIDLAVTRRIAQAIKARFVFTGEINLPPRAEWEHRLSVAVEGDEPARQIRELLALEAEGAEVLLIAADVAEDEAARKLVAQVREQFGAVNGVIHSASKTGGGMVQLKTSEAAEAVLAPKVRGTLALASALADAPPDFLVLFSTSLAVTGVFGQVDYCAANAFLDAFAHAQAARGETFTAAVNWHIPQWEAWQDAAVAGAPEFQSQLAQVREAYGISLTEGAEAFMRVVAGAQPQVVVSTQNFQSLLDEQAAAAGDSGLLAQLEQSRAATAAQARAAASGDYTPPASELEGAVAGVWQELFGIERIGTNDSFFDLGGNSLLAIQLISQLRKVFDVELPLNSLFESPTVAGLAEVITAHRQKDEDAEEIERLLREIESLSLDEVHADLAQEMQPGGEVNQDG